MNQASRSAATSQVATQPPSPPDPVEPFRYANPEQSQQEQPQEQGKSTAQEQVQLTLDKPSRKSTTDVDEFAVPFRIVEREAQDERAKEEKEKRESEEKKMKECKEKTRSEEKQIEVNTQKDK